MDEMTGAASGQSLVAKWNEVMLDAIRSGSALPTETTYQLHLVSTAVYDAWAAYDGDAAGYYVNFNRPEAEATEANKAEAISYAAHAMLTELFPDQADDFDAFMDSLGYDPDADAGGIAKPAGLGKKVVDRILKAREGDGSNAENDFADTSGYAPVNSADPDADNAPGGDTFDPNHWQPLRVPNGTLVDADGVPIADDSDPSTYDDQIALTPHWGSVTPVSLESGDQFRPAAPPQLGDFEEYRDGTGAVTTGDQAYRDQVQEVMDYSAGLTNEQKVIAEYWADGPRTESPPGHWNQIAQDIALREGHGIDEDAKLFFAVNAAIFDAGIATWEAKYAYDYIRPQSAIRDLFFDETIDAWGGPNKGTQEILGQEWQPYQKVTFVTPPFPEFVSGHSTFSMAAAKTIAAFVGSDAFYDGESLSNYDLDGVNGIDKLGEYVTSDLIFEDFGDGPAVVLQWETLTEAAEEAGISRLYGGIHIQDGNLRGLDLGEKVASTTEEMWMRLFSTDGTDVLGAPAEGGLVEGGAGADVLTGSDVADRLFGGRGTDSIDGNGGGDILSGGRGADTANGGAGRDLVLGDEGRDLLSGGDNNDKVRGGKGADVVLGDAGDDRLFGNAGDDILFGGLGTDLMVGGFGADAFVLKPEDGAGIDTIRRFQEGVDTIEIASVADLSGLALSQDGDDVRLAVDGVDLAVIEDATVSAVAVATVAGTDLPV